MKTRLLQGESQFIRLVLSLVDADDPELRVVGGFVDALRVELDNQLDDLVSMTVADLDYPEAAESYAEAI